PSGECRYFSSWVARVLPPAVQGPDTVVALGQAALGRTAHGQLIAYFNRDHAELMAKINVKGDFNDEIDAGIKAGIEKFKATQTW
ncbi:hypothetical protein, partial [Pseudomonas fragi]|uniref:hypothetical protein n=1 Tax=Pseudomonas fragi TaxID=296 RepID=UPI003820376D